MASQFGAATLPIVDIGNVPFFWIDGMHEYEIRDGNVFSTFHRIRPLPQRAIAFSPWLARARFPNVTIACTLETQLAMSEQATKARAQFARASDGRIRIALE